MLPYKQNQISAVSITRYCSTNKMFPNYYLLIFSSYFIFENDCLDMISSFRQFHLDAMQDPRKIPSYEEFITRIENKNRDGMRQYPRAKFTGDYRHMSEICSNIADFIGAELLISSRKFEPFPRCEFTYPEVDYSVNLHILDVEYPGFMHHYLKKSRKTISHPIGVVYFKSNAELFGAVENIIWENNDIDKLDDLVFYDPLLRTIHFEERFGFLVHMKELRQNLDTFPTRVLDLTATLLEGRKNDIQKTQCKLLACDKGLPLLMDNGDVIYNEIALYIGAVYTNPAIDIRKYTFPATGITLTLVLDYNRVDMARYLKYFVENVDVDPFYAYVVAEISSNEHTLYGNMPHDLFYFELKHRTYGPLNKLNYRSYALKKGLSHKLMI